MQIENKKMPWYTYIIKYRELGLIAIIALLVAIVSLFNPLFFKGSKMLFIVEDTSVLAILAAGMMCVMLVGSIDISIAGIMALSAMVAGIVMRENLVSTDTTQMINGVETIVTVKTSIGSSIVPGSPPTPAPMERHIDSEERSNSSSVTTDASDP